MDSKGPQPVGGANYGATAAGGRRVRKQALGVTREDLIKILALVLVPPICFMVVSAILCFRVRYENPKLMWFFAGLSGIPTGVAAKFAKMAKQRQEDSRWPTLVAVLFGLALALSIIVGEVNYWYFAQPYFAISAMRSYTEVNPAETEGKQFMDAGIVHFARGTRLGLDMAMSFTSEHVYCVAPITTYRGLPSQGEGLAVYDFWAVGVDCCSSGDTNFFCGEYDQVDVRAGLRQVSAEQQPYFRLAVEQAEAEYNIRAAHPIFLYWVTDPLKEKDLFFTAAFGNWVLAQGMHFSVNALIVIVFVIMFNKASKDADAHLLTALQL